MDIIGATISFSMFFIYILICVCGYQSIKASQDRMKITQRHIDEMLERKRIRDAKE